MAARKASTLQSHLSKPFSNVQRLLTLSLAKRVAVRNYANMDFQFGCRNWRSWPYKGPREACKSDGIESCNRIIQYLLNMLNKKSASCPWFNVFNLLAIRTYSVLGQYYWGGCSSDVAVHYLNYFLLNPLEFPIESLSCTSRFSNRFCSRQILLKPRIDRVRLFLSTHQNWKYRPYHFFRTVASLVLNEPFRLLIRHHIVVSFAFLIFILFNLHHTLWLSISNTSMNPLMRSRNLWSYDEVTSRQSLSLKGHLRTARERVARVWWSVCSAFQVLISKH